MCYTDTYLNDVIEGLAHRAEYAFQCSLIPLPDRQVELDRGNRLMADASRVCDWANKRATQA